MRGPFFIWEGSSADKEDIVFHRISPKISTVHSGYLEIAFMKMDIGMSNGRRRSIKMNKAAKKPSPKPNPANHIQNKIASPTSHR